MNRFDLTDVLIVEDNPNDAELIVRTFKKHHLASQVFIAEDGEEALDFLFYRGQFASRNRSKPIRVVFLDLKLPKVNGLEVLKEIKENEETRSLPVVIITSSREDSDIKTAYELGANSYIVKPVNFTEFIHVIGTTGEYWLMVNEAQR
jgi:two-component system response regulator